MNELINYLKTMLKTSMEMGEIAMSEFLENPTEDNFTNVVYWNAKVDTYYTKLENYLEIINKLES